MSAVNNAANMTQSLRLTMNSVVVVTMYARVISEQPFFNNVQKIPNLSQHMSNCKAHSENWLNNIVPSLIGVVTDVIQFATSFTEVHDEIIQYVGMLRNGDESAKETIEEILQDILISDMDEQVSKIHETIDQVQQFHHDYLSDMLLFQNDSGEAEAAMTKDRADIKKTNTDLNLSLAEAHDYQTAIEDLEYALIATASASVACPIFGIVIGGVAMIAEGTTIGVLESKYSDALDDVNNDMIKIANLKADLAVLQNVKSHLLGMQSAIKKVLTKITEVRDSWVKLKGYASDTLAVIQKALPSTIDKDIALKVEIRINQAMGEWQNTLKQAEKIKPSGEEIRHIKAESVKELTKIVKYGVPDEV